MNKSAISRGEIHRLYLKVFLFQKIVSILLFLCILQVALLLLFVFFTNHPYRLRFYGARSIFMSVHAWALSKILFDGLAAKLR